MIVRCMVNDDHETQLGSNALVFRVPNPCPMSLAHSFGRGKDAGRFIVASARKHIPCATSFHSTTPRLATHKPEVAKESLIDQT